MPALVMEAGNNAQFAYEEFFFGRIRNPHTRKNYRHATHKFLDSCAKRGLELHRIAPMDVGRYLDSLDYAPETKKLHLSALRHFFDELVLRHVVILNPAAAVRSERHQVMKARHPKSQLSRRAGFCTVSTRRMWSDCATERSSAY